MRVSEAESAHPDEGIVVLEPIMPAGLAVHSIPLPSYLDRPLLPGHGRCEKVFDEGFCIPTLPAFGQASLESVSELECHVSPSSQLVIFLHPFLFFPVFRKTDLDVPTTNRTSRKTHEESPSPLTPGLRRGGLFAAFLGGSSVLRVSKE